ncbi:MAG: VgrG protein, partial [Myxococcales bacterium]|nr:VgrG protein [Myxococcales bacterium]
MSDLDPPAVTTDPVLARRQPRWSVDRTEDNLARTFVRIERARTRARVGVATGLALGAVVVAFGVSHRQEQPSVVATSPSTSVRAPAPRATELAPPLVLAEVTTVAPRGAATRAVVTRATPERVELALSGGAASFAVPPHGRREVFVSMARFEVKILAAAFTLAPEGARAQVDVAEGSVDVSWPGGHAVVPAGSSALLPPESPASASTASVATPARDDGHASRARFLMQVAKRDYAGAYRSLVTTPSVADHSPEGLMRAADAARLSGHPAAAVPYYERVVGDFAADARAPVAAFTLGRVLLTQLDRPRD